MKAYCTVVRRAKCADWYIPVFELFEKDDDFHVALLRHVAQRNTGRVSGERRDWSRAWSRDKSRVWNVSKNAGISRIGVKIVRGNELKSRDRNDGKSRDWNGGMTTQQTTQQTTQETTRQTTQQAPWNIPRGESGLKKNPMNSYNEGNLTW